MPMAIAPKRVKCGGWVLLLYCINILCIRVSGFHQGFPQGRWQQMTGDVFGKRIIFEDYVEIQLSNKCLPMKYRNIVQNSRSLPAAELESLDFAIVVEEKE